MKSLRVPLLLFALPAGLIALSPVSQVPLLLDRGAVAGGEIWRLWTGHWVHFSASHLGWNLAVLLIAGTWLEWVQPGLPVRHALAAPPFIGLVVLCCEPRLNYYGGLSGLATGVVVLLALYQWRQPDAGRWLWTGVLALVALKCTGDLLQFSPAFARYDELTVRTSSTAHAAGAAAALLHHVLGRSPDSRHALPAPGWH